MELIAENIHHLDDQLHRQKLKLWKKNDEKMNNDFLPPKRIIWESKAHIVFFN